MEYAKPAAYISVDRTFHYEMQVKGIRVDNCPFLQYFIAMQPCVNWATCNWPGTWYHSHPGIFVLLCLHTHPAIFIVHEWLIKDDLCCNWKPRPLMLPVIEAEWHNLTHTDQHIAMYNFDEDARAEHDPIGTHHFYRMRSYEIKRKRYYDGIGLEKKDVQTITVWNSWSKFNAPKFYTPDQTSYSYHVHVTSDDGFDYMLPYPHWEPGDLEKNNKSDIKLWTSFSALAAMGYEAMMVEEP